MVKDRTHFWPISSLQAEQNSLPTETFKYSFRNLRTQSLGCTRFRSDDELPVDVCLPTGGRISLDSPLSINICCIW